MRIIRFLNSYILAYIAAMISIIVGFTYLQNFLSSTFTLFRSVSQLSDGQALIELWATFAICGGFIIIILNFMAYYFQHSTLKRFLQAITLLAMLLLIVAQLLPLFWWIFVGSVSISWQSALGLFLHLILLLVALGATLSILNDLIPTTRQQTTS